MNQHRMDPGPTTAVSCRGLMKRFGSLVAVDGVDLDIGVGELYALLGRNGAGKTTIVGMLTTLLEPTAGQAWVAGCSILDQPELVRQRVGVVLQESALDRWLSVEENLIYLARAYHLPWLHVRRRVDQVIDQMGLGPVRKTVIGHLSGGNKQRTEIAAGILHRPAVLLLDEPTVGLDVEARRKIWDHVRQIQAEGTAVLLTTHYLDEADALADRIGIMDHGRMVAEDTTARLKARMGRRQLRLRAIGPGMPILSRSLAALGTIGVDGDALRLQAETEEGVKAALAAIAAAPGVDVQELGIGTVSLDDAFLHAVSRPAGDLAGDAR